MPAYSRLLQPTLLVGSKRLASRARCGPRTVTPMLLRAIELSFPCRSRCRSPPTICVEPMAVCRDGSRRRSISRQLLTSASSAPSSCSSCRAIWQDRRIGQRLSRGVRSRCWRRANKHWRWLHGWQRLQSANYSVCGNRRNTSSWPALLEAQRGLGPDFAVKHAIDGWNLAHPI